MVSALAYCHERHVAHRDVKLENFMLDDRKNVKLIDFGFSCCSDKHLKIFCGTPSYMSPEIVSKKDYSGPQADAWALGVVLYVFLTGHFPFKAPSDRELYRKISKGVFSFPDESYWNMDEFRGMQISP